jgi:hypothetical protein
MSRVQDAIATSIRLDRPVDLTAATDAERDELSHRANVYVAGDASGTVYTGSTSVGTWIVRVRAEAVASG